MNVPENETSTELSDEQLANPSNGVTEECCAYR